MALPRDGARQVIDFHVHVGPEVLARRYDVVTLGDEAAAMGFGVVLEHHSIATAPLAARARARGALMAGGVVLDEGVGGFNPAAVDARGLSRILLEQRRTRPHSGRAVRRGDPRRRAGARGAQLRPRPARDGNGLRRARGLFLGV